MNKLAIVFATLLATAVPALAVTFTPPAPRPAAAPRGHGVHGHGGRRPHVFTTTFRHVPLSNPNDPFHDTYRKNLGETKTETKTVTKTVDTADLDRRIRELETRAAVLQAKLDGDATRKSPISVFSTASLNTKTKNEPVVNIYNSNVTITAR